MTSNERIDIDKNDLICPITYQLFCDPVIAGDGHTYERAAIVRWIEEHGTSPLTRQTLNANELQENDYLKKLAVQQQTSSTSSTDNRDFDYRHIQRQNSRISNDYNIYFDRPVFIQPYQISASNIYSIDNNANAYESPDYLSCLKVVTVFLFSVIFFLFFLYLIFILSLR